MASKKKKDVIEDASAGEEDFAADLISALNKEFASRIAYNLSVSDSPTHVKRWISTGSTLLDYIVANRPEGGVPEGRIIEVFGEPSTGKSHIAFAVAATVQKMGGLVVYIDTENATPVEKLANMGIDVRKRFVYCDTHCTEEVFQIAEATIKKITESIPKNKKASAPPVLIVWDSVAATSPKQELEGDYDDNTMGLQARVISKAMRKITGVIGKNNVTFMCLNQVRMKIGVAFGDPTVTPGGKAIPFHASVRLGLTGGSPVKDKEGNVIGIKTYVTVKKNKVGPPHRRAEIEIRFGEGIFEDDSILDMLSEATKKKGAIERDGKLYKVEGGSWRMFTVTTDDGEVLHEKKFQKPSFGKMLKSDEHGRYLMDMIDSVMVIHSDNKPAEEEIEEEEEE